MKGVPALVKPALLTWARQSAQLGVDALAEKVGVSRQVVLDWESGTKELSIPQLRKFGDVCKRPLAVFYLDAPPVDFDAARLPDFRKLPDTDGGGISPELAYELRRAVHRQQIAAELANEIHYDVLGFDLHAAITENVEAVADRVRAYLEITFEQQQAWKDTNEALRSWRAAAEAHGILVFRMSVPIEEARGFSLSADRLPVVVLNAKELPVARIFTLLHEIAHLALRRGGICDLHDEGIGSDIEVFCNAVAGAVAVPANKLKVQAEVRSRASDADWDDQAIATLAKRFSVSREVVVRRLLSLGKVSEAFYRAKRKLYLSQSVRSDTGGFEAPADKAVRTNGGLFTRLVLASHSERAITTADVSSYLDVRVSHLDAIANAVWS